LFGDDLLDVSLALEVLALDKVGNVILIVVLLVLTLDTLLHALVALGELAERSERVGAKLVKNAGDELGQLLVLTVTVDGEGVGGDGGVDYGGWARVNIRDWRRRRRRGSVVAANSPLGAAKWITLPSDLNMLTSSMEGMGWTFIFLRAAWSFLSSPPPDLLTFLTFLLGVPLPLFFVIHQSRFARAFPASFPTRQKLTLQRGLAGHLFHRLARVHTDAHGILKTLELCLIHSCG
jgi:hypothetical protein